MKSVKFDISRMNHTGGSKFYETAWFECGDNFITVFRWGKVSERDSGGGQTKIEIHNASFVARAACENKQAEKRKRGYADVASVAPTSVGADRFPLMLAERYSNAETVDRICELMGVESGGPAVSAGEVVIEEPEIERGGDWGSW